MEWVNQAELGREAEVSKQYINKLVKKGVLKKDKNGKLDKEKSLEIIQNLQSKGSNGNGNGDDDGEKGGYWDQQTRLAKHKADMAEMESLKMSGQFIDIDVAAAEFGKFALAIRERFIGQGARLAQRLVKKSPAFIKREIDQDVQESLSDIATYSPESGDLSPSKPARKTVKRRAKNGAKGKAHRKSVGK